MSNCALQRHRLSVLFLLYAGMRIRVANALLTLHRNILMAFWVAESLSCTLYFIKHLFYIKHKPNLPNRSPSFYWLNLPWNLSPSTDYHKTLRISKIQIVQRHDTGVFSGFPDKTYRQPKSMAFHISINLNSSLKGSDISQLIWDNKLATFLKHCLTDTGPYFFVSQHFILRVVCWSLTTTEETHCWMLVLLHFPLLPLSPSSHQDNSNPHPVYHLAIYLRTCCGRSHFQRPFTIVFLDHFQNPATTDKSERWGMRRKNHTGHHRSEWEMGRLPAVCTDHSRFPTESSRSQEWSRPGTPDYSKRLNI